MSRIILTALTIAFVSLPAMAQTLCGERGEFLSHLSRAYAEAPVAIGVVSDGAVLEVLASKHGSWTVIVTRPDGMSCVVASGEDWEALPMLTAGPSA